MDNVDKSYVSDNAEVLAANAAELSWASSAGGQP